MKISRTTVHLKKKNKRGVYGIVAHSSRRNLDFSNFLSHGITIVYGLVDILPDFPRGRASASASAGQKPGRTSGQKSPKSAHDREASQAWLVPETSLDLAVALPSPTGVLGGKVLPGDTLV